MPIRVLHIVEALGVGGGVENGIANLLARMDRDRFEHLLCAVFDTGPQLERYPLDRVPLRSLGLKRGRLNTQIAPLARMIREARPDIIHSRNWGTLEAVPAGRWARVPAVIHSEHGVEMDPAAEPWRRRWIRRAAYTMAHQVFSVSGQLRNILAQQTGYPLRKIGVIHNGVDLTRFRADSVARRRFRQELGVREDEFCAGAVGRLNQIKDYPTLLRAMEVFNASCSAWRLFIVGSGSEAGALQQAARMSPALHGRVSFLGRSDRVPEFLNAMDVYVLPSICEGISNALLEAMATGLPAVVSETGGNTEVVVDGVSGLLFPVGSFEGLAGQLCRIWRDRELRDQLARAALKRVGDEFSLESMVRKYETLYESLAGVMVTREPLEQALCRSGD